MSQLAGTTSTPPPQPHFKQALYTYKERPPPQLTRSSNRWSVPAAPSGWVCRWGGWGGRAGRRDGKQRYTMGVPVSAVQRSSQTSKVLAHKWRLSASATCLEQARLTHLISGSRCAFSKPISGGTLAADTLAFGPAGIFVMDRQHRATAGSPPCTAGGTTEDHQGACCAYFMNRHAALTT